MELFHGSSMIVQQPKVLINGYYKDFGNWLSSNILHIKLYFVQNRRFQH